VIAVDAELLRASVVREIAAARSVSSTAKHAETVAALRDAETAVTQAARAVLTGEMVSLAAEFTAALDAALAIGRQLEEMTMGDQSPRALGFGPTWPAVVTAALDRMPKLHSLDTPLHILRNGGGSSDAWASRFKQLTADSIDGSSS
jgi:hypothetical protein